MFKTKISNQFFKKRSVKMLKKVSLATMILAGTVGMASASPVFYVGGGMGIVNNTSTHGTNGQPGYFRGVPFNAFFGYGGQIDQSYYLAGEAGGTLGTGEFTNKNGLKTSYGYYVSILPGLMLSDHTVAFGRAGYINSRFTNVGNSVSGIQFGLGLQSSITQSVDVRGEYDYSAFSSVDNISSPRQDLATVSIIYRFE
jgi:opacity protein-like surface antigen